MGCTSSLNRLNGKGSTEGRDVAWLLVIEEMKSFWCSHGNLVNWEVKATSLKLVQVVLVGKWRACLMMSGEREKILFP